MRVYAAFGEIALGYAMSRLRRRAFLGAGALAAFPPRLYAQTATASRPRLLQGVQAGDVGADGATIWGRADRPARMIVDYATTESFTDARRVEGPSALGATDFTSRIRLDALPPGQTIFYRVTYLDLGDLKTLSEPAVGRFRTPPASGAAASSADVSFVWSADTAGQGWGINPEIGGMTIYESMRRLAPDFFVHCGDTIYADNPLSPEKKLPDGRLWKNLVTEAKSKVAESLDEFRGNHLYNFLDDNLRRFNAEVPMMALWDDHEVVDNWTWEKRLDADPRYK
ncbi:MAG: alkaline phosphatase D family protein, partial [Verrucomicrobia bacterium]|nr:alkaline phosphatase D family protein [Verrucomicrobiota bacterium]